MKEEDKELLLKDLCARLPYGVKVQHQHQDYLNEVQTVEHISRKYGEIETESVLGFVDDFKPYLRPMSSMTGDELKELKKMQQIKSICSYHTISMDLEFINWYLAHHFDINHLIDRGLAIEVTKENNPYEE